MCGNQTPFEAIAEDWQDRFFGYGLNFGETDERPDEFYRHIGVLKEAICPECGTVFYYTNVEQWGYKIKTSSKSILFCRYNCLREGQKKREAEHAEKMAARTKRRAEMKKRGAVGR